MRILAIYGFSLVVLTLVHLRWSLDDLDHTLLEFAILGGLATLVLWTLYRVWCADVPDDLFLNVSRWCFRGIAFTLLVTIPSAYYVGFPLAGHDAVFAYQLALSIGGLGGLLVGYHEAGMVSEARQTAQSEAERRRLEYLNRLLRHDVLNNLTVIDGNLALVLEDVEDEETKRRVETARRQSREATEHIQNVRVLVQSARGERPTERVDFSAVVETELSQLRDAYPDAEITADVPASVHVRADDLVGSVVENLVRNAVEHNDAAVPRVSVALAPDDETVTLTVSDNGPGIPEEIRDSLFEPPAEGDHGFGLHLVKTLVERYRGTITLSESTSEGTTVAVELDCA